jgi:hypothetical protein
LRERQPRGYAADGGVEEDEQAQERERIVGLPTDWTSCIW